MPVSGNYNLLCLNIQLIGPPQVPSKLANLTAQVVITTFPVSLVTSSLSHQQVENCLTFQKLKLSWWFEVFLVVPPRRLLNISPVILTTIPSLVLVSCCLGAFLPRVANVTSIRPDLTLLTMLSKLIRAAEIACQITN